MNARMRNLLAACLSFGFLAVPASAHEDVRFEVAADQRQVSAGDEVEFTITIRNDGDVAASNLSVSAGFSAGVEPMETSGTKENAGLGRDNEVNFPAIASLNAGETIVLGIRAKMTRAGVTTCRVSVTNPGLGGLTLRKDEAIRVK